MIFTRFAVNIRNGPFFILPTTTVSEGTLMSAFFCLLTDESRLMRMDQSVFGSIFVKSPSIRKTACKGGLKHFHTKLYKINTV